MKADKKVIESITVASLAMALAITAVTGNGINTAGHSQAVETQLEENGIAGVAVTVNRYNEEAADELNNLSIEKEEMDILSASAEPDVSIEEEMAAVRETAVSIKDTISAKDSSAEKKAASAEDKWENKLMAKVDNFLYVREKPDADSKVVGKMYKGDCATIKKTGKTWTKIKSGKVTGYVKNEYCVTGKKAYKYAKKHCDTVAKVSIDGLRIRKKPSTDAAVIKAVASGDKLVVDTKAKKKDGWVAVKVGSGTCYVSDEYVTVKLNTGKAITLADEMAAWKAAQERKAAANAAASGNNSSSSAGTTNAPTSVSADDETLLAALIQCEAGGEGSRCMTAVAAVVLNRVHSSSFPNTIRGVIYQSGQFGPASSGRLASRLANGVSPSARAAARAALNGSDPTGGAKYFKLASSGHAGVVIGAVVFY